MRYGYMVEEPKIQNRFFKRYAIKKTIKQMCFDKQNYKLANEHRKQSRYEFKKGQ